MSITNPITNLREIGSGRLRFRPADAVFGGFLELRLVARSAPTAC
jgi:hypothetical protein